MYCWMRGKEREGWGVEQEWNKHLIGSGKVWGQIRVGVISGYSGRHALPVYPKYMCGLFFGVEKRIYAVLKVKGSISSGGQWRAVCLRVSVR